MAAACEAMFTRYFDARGLSRDLLQTQASGVADPVTLVFDDTHRIQFSMTMDGRALVRARIIDMPAPGEQRDHLIEQVARMGVRPALRHGASCVIDRDERAVWLQWIEWPTLKPAEFEQSMDGYVDILAFWKMALSRIGGGVAALAGTFAGVPVSARTSSADFHRHIIG